MRKFFLKKMKRQFRESYLRLLQIQKRMKEKLLTKEAKVTVLI
jgi:hypothetical protein